MLYLMLTREINSFFLSFFLEGPDRSTKICKMSIAFDVSPLERLVFQGGLNINKKHCGDVLDQNILNPS